MVRTNKKTERLEVLEPCLKLCKGLLGKQIIKYRRLDALDSYHEPGEPDIEIWIPQTDRIFILMSECKKPDGGILLNTQIKYRNKYNSFNNVRYVEVRSAEELRLIIIELSHYMNKEFNEFMNTGEL